LSKIISIGTAVPSYKHEQSSIMQFMQDVYALDPVEKRKIRFLYHQSGIAYRYSVIPDYSRKMNEWKFYPHSENLEPFPSIENRMVFYNKYAPTLSVEAVRKCLGHFPVKEITHLITVSCTGMSAPGLDLQVMELLDLPKNIFRTSVNFMGCYAAIHAMKMADMICKTSPSAKVLIVCTELCTLHFQKEPTMDNIASSLLFGDGSAAVLVSNDNSKEDGIIIHDFYAEVSPKGKKDMAWELSSTGFLMTLSGYVPELIEEDFEGMISRALKQSSLKQEDVESWCIHPGGRKILEAIQKSLNLDKSALQKSYDVLNDFGNMSSPTIIFVLEKYLEESREKKTLKPMVGAAFGPGLTMETFVASA
jgi:predicted naringenin-chalcone synthase